jgi:hypothetical protein
MDCAIPLQKTHNILFEPRRLCYPWHPWFGRSVLTRKAGGAHAQIAYFCRLPDAPLDAMLVEVPRWMFDASKCARMRLAEIPHVDCATLCTLKVTIAEQYVSVKTVVLQPQLPKQVNHGGTDANTSKKKSNGAVGVVQRKSRCATLARSQRAHTHRGNQPSSPPARQRSHRKSGSQHSKSRKLR